MASVQDVALVAALVVGWAVVAKGRTVLPSSVQVTALPGIKWLPCRWSVPPGVTSALPCIERDGARIVRPAPMMLARITSVTTITMISHVAQPGVGCGCGLPDSVGPGLCGRRVP